VACQEVQESTWTRIKKNLAALDQNSNWDGADFWLRVHATGTPTAALGI